MTASPRTLFEQPRLLLAAAAAYSMSTLFSAMKPILLTGFVNQTGWSDELAGLTVAMPFVGIAVSALIVAKLVRRFSLRALAGLFGALLVIGEALSAWLFAVPGIVLPLQFGCGIAVGVLMGASSRVIATTRAPAEKFGFVDMSAVLLMSAMVAIVGYAVNSYGIAGGYASAAVVGLVFTGAMLTFREAHGQSSQDTLEKTPLPMSRRAIAVVVMGVLFVTASGMGFAYMFSIARTLNMDYARASEGIGLVLFASAFACMAGGWCSARFGPYKPLAAAFICCALGWYFVVHAPNATVFFLALVPAVFSLQFNFPVLLSLAGSLDPNGQWSAVATPLLTSGFAWAAIAAGLIAGRYGMSALAVGCAVGMLICLVLLLPASGGQDPALRAQHAKG